MDFVVNGQKYVFAFLAGEGSFALFEKDEEGVKRLKIVHDDGPIFVAPLLDVEGSEKTPTLN